MKAILRAKKLRYLKIGLCDTAKLLLDIARILGEGLLPTTSTMRLNSRKTKNYLQAFCDIFLLNRITPSHDAIGKDAYFIADTGIASHLIRNKVMSDEATRSKVNGWDTRPLEGTMKKLKLKQGIVLTGSTEIFLEPKGISVLPWSYFS